MTFEQFLKSKKISVVKGRILLKDAKEVVKLEGEFEIIQAQKKGLPEQFAPYAKTVISVSFDEMERQNQDPEKFGCTLARSHKNFDNEDTWGGTVKGETRKIWEWALAESGQSPDEIEGQIEIGIEEYEADKDKDDK